MADNFKILIHRNDDNVHMKLSGDFDKSSAYELLNHLRKCCPKFATIFIHTDCLKRVIPFGLGVFRHNLSELYTKHIRSYFYRGECFSILIMISSNKVGTHGQTRSLPQSWT
jgi:hypothetical protein